MKSVNPKSVVLKFIQQINEQDADGLAALMSENHLFVEPLGNSMKGRSRIREGWRGYVIMFPDYEVSVCEIFQKCSRFAPFRAAREPSQMGSCRGRIDGKSLQLGRQLSRGRESQSGEYSRTITKRRLFSRGGSGTYRTCFLLSRPRVALDTPGRRDVRLGRYWRFSQDFSGTTRRFLLRLSWKIASSAGS